MKLLAETIVFELPCYLSEKDVKYWASMTKWFRTEAVMLSLGLDPRRTGDSKVNHKEASRLRNEFIERDDLLEEVKESCDAENYQYSNHEYLYDPEKYVKWAKANFSSFPENLYLAVINNAAPRKQHIDSSEKESTGNPGSEARWAERREIIKKAEEYVKKSLKNGCEYCDHCQLADYMCQNASDDQGNTLFEYPDVDESKMMDYLKEGAKRALKKNYPHRIVGNTGYTKSDGVCEVHPVKR